MICPNKDCVNYNQEVGGNFCPECGTKLIERPAQPDGFNLSFGDAAAISGGINMSDSHNIHNEDHSVHNISNITSTVNNITQVSVQKTEMELLQERKTLYLNACKRAYEDNILEQSEMMELDRYRIELGLDESTADKILDKVRLLAMAKVQKTELSGFAKIKLKQLTDALEKNDVKAIMQQIDGFDALAGKFANDELQYYYYMVLAALQFEKCIEKYENSKVDNYWRSFWSYLAYLKAGRIEKAAEILISLDDKYPNFPEDNKALLSASEAIFQKSKEIGLEYLATLDGNYTPALQRFVETLYLLLEPEAAKEMGATEEGCVFYSVNFFQYDRNKNNVDKTLNNYGKVETDSNHKTASPLADTLEKKWHDMTIEAYKMILEANESDDFVSIMNMLIPPAMAQVPLAMALTAAGFSNFGHVDEGERWADRLMSLDPNNQDADVMMAKATIYEEGFGRYEKNIQYAIAFYRAAAIKGNMDALGFVADLYFEGEDIKQDFRAALTWAKTAYEAKNPFGLYIYGRAYLEGKGLPKDTITGKRLIREASEMNDVYSVGVVEAKLYMKKRLK